VLAEILKQDLDKSDSDDIDIVVSGESSESEDDVVEIGAHVSDEIDDKPSWSERR